MAGIRAVLTNLVALETDISITDPITTTTGKAYKYLPHQKTAIDFPAFLNTWTFPDQTTEDGSFAQGSHRYSIEIQCLIDDADRDQGLEIATAFWEAFLNAWVADQQLKNGGARTILGTELTGAEPTLSELLWDGTTYYGWTATRGGGVDRV